MHLVAAVTCTVRPRRCRWRGDLCSFFSIAFDAVCMQAIPQPAPDVAMPPMAKVLRQLRVDVARKSAALSGAAALLSSGALLATRCPCDAPWLAHTRDCLLCVVGASIACTHHCTASSRLRRQLTDDAAMVADAMAIGRTWPLVTVPALQPLIPNSLRTLRGHLTMAAVCVAPPTHAASAAHLHRVTYDSVDSLMLAQV